MLHLPIYASFVAPPLRALSAHAIQGSRRTGSALGDACNRVKSLTWLTAAASAFAPFAALASENAPSPNVLNAGDTAWMMTATALVMLMTPGLAFFYSGMVRTGNVVATIMHSYLKLCVITLVWILWGYSLSFGTSLDGIIGGFDFLGASGVGALPANIAPTIPHALFATYQGMFAVITAAIITGSFAERVKLLPVLVFSVAWITIVYAPVAHWVWGGGWIMTQIKALDFAGGGVVHINAGVAGLVAALVLGRRTSMQEDATEFKPHNLPQTILGSALLWFGWFGFNAGSALAANGLACMAFLNTNVAAAGGAIGWIAFEIYHRRKLTSLGVISGSIAGLVAITPAAGYITPMASIVTGLIGGLLCYAAVTFVKPKIGYDDSLDAFGIHGVGGIWGGIAVGLFSTTSINPAGEDGLFYGNMALLGRQLVATISIVAYSGWMTFVILKCIGFFMQFRVSPEEEELGLDETQHGEIGYSLH